MVEIKERKEKHINKDKEFEQKLFVNFKDYMSKKKEKEIKTIHDEDIEAFKAKKHLENLENTIKDR